MLIDTHAHLASSRFVGEVDQIVENAHAAGVDRIVTISCDLEDSPVNIGFANKFPGVYAAVGIHPCYVGDINTPEYIAELRQLADDPKVVAIGEIGLDYFHAPPEGYTVETWRARQDEVFRAQLDLAIELDLPVIVHQRESSDDTMAVLQSYRETSLRAVLHCFTGTMEQAALTFEMEHLISFTGIVTFSSARDVQAVAASIPGGCFMVETDSPYLAPVPRRGKRCEPSDVRHTAEYLANLRNLSLRELANDTTTTAERFFKKLRKS